MQAKLAKIHDASMLILEEIGIRLHHPDILEMLKNQNVRVENNIAYFTRNQIMEQIGKAPRQFTLYARNPLHNIVIGGDNSEYLAGYGCSAIIEPDGSRRNAMTKDYIRFVKLVQQSSGFRVNGGILVQPYDIPPNQTHLLMPYLTMCYSDKCIMGIPGNAQQVKKIMDMACILFGGRNTLQEKPRVISLVNTLSPLQLDRNVLETIKVHAEYGQALIIAACVMSGGTAPITLAGAIAQGNAETLAGIAIAQMIRPGTPTVMGLVMMPMDMRTGGVNIGAPAHSLSVKYCSGLAKRYGLPCRCGGNSTNANGVTVQSGYESMMAMFVSLQEKVNLILHSAGILDGYAAMSYEKFVTDLEVIRMAEYYFEEMATDDNALALNAIREVGHGGEFLTNMHTMQNCRKEAWISDIANTGPLKKTVSPHDAMMKKIKEKLESMIEGYQSPEIDADIKQRLDSYLIENGVSLDFLQ